MIRKNIVGAFARDLFKWFLLDLENVAARIRSTTVLKIEAEISRWTGKYRNDHVGFAAMRARIIENQKASSEIEAIDSYITHFERALQSLKDRKAMIGVEGSQHDVRTSLLRRVK